MSYLDYIPRLPAFTGRGCVQELRQVLLRMGNPQDRVKCVHVTGTNGKGSVCAMIECALRHAGYRTGLYTSPYLVRFNERIRIDGQEASDQALELSARRVYEAQEGEKLTHFGFITAMMFDMFVCADVDIAVIEAGMGGGTDPTVLCNSLVCAVTGVSLDHTAILGDTLEKIAQEKAGIIKPGVPVVLGVCPDSPAGIIRNKARELNSPFTRIRPEDISKASCTLSGTRFVYRGAGYELNLLGEYQIYNGACAVSCLEYLNQYSSFKSDLRDISSALWPGRLDLRKYRGRDILLDGAHNPDGAGALSDFLKRCADGRRIVLVCAVMKDKDYLGVCARLAPLAEMAVAVGMPEYPRALAASELKNTFEKQGLKAYEASELRKGLELAMRLDNDALILVCGSLYLVGEALALLSREGK